MAINKRKVLDAARKHAQKGAKQRALKEYNKLIQADPRDAKLLLEVGDAYRRWGQAEEAIAQYTKVANQYKADGFDARAVAVLKQILNLDPKRYTAHVSLAELYQRMGLDPDAIGALQTAADGYYRDGRRKEALELLRKMAALDPSNTTSRLKVADLLKQEGIEKDAVHEYEEVVAELTRQGANEQVTVVQERILEIETTRTDVMVSLAQNLSDLGRPERAEVFAQRAVETGREPDHYELLCGIYKSLGNDVRLAEVTRELASVYRERGDEDKARDVIQRIPGAAFDGGSLGADRTDASEAAMLGDDELLDDDFLATDESEVVSLDNELGSPVDDLSAPLGNETVAPTPLHEMPLEEVAAEPEPVEEPLPEGDPDQLFAEASVYLRYGKRDQAVASLKAVLLQDPDHRGALEKLGEAHAEGGDSEAAVSCWLKAAEAARSADDADGYNIIRDRIGALDAQAAAELEPMGAVADDVSETADAVELDFVDDVSEVEVSETTDVSEAMDFELDISVEDELSEAGVDLSDAETGDVEIDLEADGAETADAFADESVEMEIEFDDVTDEEPVAEESEAASLDLEDTDFEIEVDAGEEAPAAKKRAAEPEGASEEQIQEELEEAEFYIQQGLGDEAEAIYRRVLSVAPGHPTVLLKLGELAAAKGGEPVVESEMPADVPGEEEEESVDLSLDEDSGFELDADSTDADEPGVSEDLAAILAEAEAAVDAQAPGQASDEGESLSVELDVSDVNQISDDATEVEHLDLDGDPAPQFAREPVQAEPEPSYENTDDTMPLPDGGEELEDFGAFAEEAESEAEPIAAAADDDADFDLAAELADVFEDDAVAEADSDPSLSQSGRSTVEEGFESIFADFKKGVSATLDEGDYDTRFDLGIAYREMELWDDAISEFQVCLDSDARRCESLHMMGLCAMELGRVADAVSHLEQALSMPDLPQSGQAGLTFDLGRAHATSGDMERARSAFEQVQALDPAFPGVAEQLAAVESGQAIEAGSDDGYESFDDIMGGDVSEAEIVEDEPEPAEPLESFDDVITEVEAVPEEHASDPVSDDDSQSKRGRPGRKKKISFV